MKSNRFKTNHFSRVWMKHPQENLGVVIKAHVGTDSQTELEIGKVGSEQVKIKLIKNKSEVLTITNYRVRIFKLTSKTVAGEVV